MRIVVFDPYKGRFFQDTVDKWSEEHEVKYIRYYDPAAVKWADVVWFETCDNNLRVATQRDDSPDFKGWSFHDIDMTNKKVIVRIIDIEAWHGHHKAVDWTFVDDIIYIAPHIKKLVEEDFIPPSRAHVIPCGVNLDKFTLSTKRDPKKIAWVCERWPTKGIDYALQVMASLPSDYELHALGKWADRYKWEEYYQKDFIKRNDIKWFEYEWVDDINEWYQDKGQVLSTSKKEAFGYSIAEGMAVGLNPIIHNFYGAEDIWPELTWETIEDAIIDVGDNGLDIEPREWLIDHGYTLDNMVKRFNEVING